MADNRLIDDMSKFEPEVHTPQVEKPAQTPPPSNANERDTLIIDAPDVLPEESSPIEAELVE